MPGEDSEGAAGGLHCSGCGRSRSTSERTVSAIKQSLVEAKLRWVMVGCLGNNVRWVGPCRIIGIHEIGF